MSTAETLRTAIRYADFAAMEDALKQGAPPNHEYLEPPSKGDVFMTPMMLVLNYLLAAREGVFVEAWKKEPEEVLEVLVRFGGNLEEREKRVMRQVVRTKFDDLCGFSSQACVDLHAEYKKRLDDAVEMVEILISQNTLNGLDLGTSGGSGGWDGGL